MASFFKKRPSQGIPERAIPQTASVLIDYCPFERYNAHAKEKWLPEAVSLPFAVMN
ncbi:MAG: hypothetical protein J5785_04450 [Spirochaetales bacterium]|nr:hypothetical protein [Spirochaetales bacterium]